LLKNGGPYGGVPALMNTIFPKSNLFDVAIERLSEIEAIANPKAPTLKTRLLKWNAPVVILPWIYSSNPKQSRI
jgi:hypothetical protein